MKKYIILFCAMLMLALGFSSCTDGTPKPWSKDAIEEIAKDAAQSIYCDMVNPTFNSVDEVVIAQDAYIDSKSIDSTFYSLKPSTLKRVADVVINKSGFADKNGIVKEYLKNISVYSNMSDDLESTATKNDKSATGDVGSGVTKEGDGLDGKVFSTEYSYHTDTVDGKPVRVQIKTEKSYVK